MTAPITVRERPILFSGPMVRAILFGRKTQTRRVVTPTPPEWIDSFGYTAFTPAGHVSGRGYWKGVPGDEGPGEKFFKSPYGMPADRLWVREAWEFLGTDMNKWGRTHRTQTGVVRYATDSARRHIDTEWQNVEKWMTRRRGTRPSIHMPRWASRLTLEITDVRVERVRAITPEDTEAEGVIDLATFSYDARVMKFGLLWDSLNAKRGFAWNVNPWVWVLTFRRVEP